MRSLLFFLILFLFFLSPVHGRESCRGLNDEDWVRIKQSKALISDVDDKSVQKTINEIEEASCPPMQAVILEAVARTYDDIVREKEVTKQKNKDWLYSKIQLNMAFLQLTGGQVQGDSDPLNMLIRSKLKRYLTDDVLTDPRFFHKVEELLE